MVLLSETGFGKEALLVYRVISVLGITGAEGLDVVSPIVETAVGDEAPLTGYTMGAVLLTGDVEEMIVIGAVGGTGGPTKEMLVDLFDIESVVLVPEESVISDIIGAVLVAIDEEPNIFDGTGVLPTISDIFRSTVDIKPVVFFIVAATVVLPRVIDILDVIGTVLESNNADPVILGIKDGDMEGVMLDVPGTAVVDGEEY